MKKQTQINKLIQQKRKETGLSQSAFAVEHGYFQGDLSRWETYVVPNVKTLKKLALILNISPCELGCAIMEVKE